MIFYDYGITFEVHLYQRPHTKRVICFACLNLLRNYFEYEYEYKQKPLECQNSQLQKRSMFNIAVTGNLNTNKTEHKFLMKLYISDFCF